MPVNDSDAWRELAAHFKELERETGGHLYALWISSSCDTSADWHTGRKWQLGGSDNPREVSFQWAAERGTVLQRGSGGEDALFYWLDLLRAQSPKYESWAPTSAANPEEVDLGRIENVCGASAEYCYKLETAAMESERQANQNGPPLATVPAMPAADPTETSPSPKGTVEGAISGPGDGRTATADADTNGDLRLSDNRQLVPVPLPPIQRHFRKVGETWSVYFDGKTVTITHRLGMTYICELLRSPGRSLNCLELQASIRRNLDKRVPKKDPEGQSPLDSFQGQEILDKTALKQYWARLQSIEEELREAEQNEDTGRRERLTAEKGMFLDELKSVTGFRRRRLRFATDAEKARKAVSRAINTALGRIKEHYPALTNHLREHIEFGISCRYEPDDVPWDF